MTTENETPCEDCGETWRPGGSYCGASYKETNFKGLK